MIRFPLTVALALSPVIAGAAPPRICTTGACAPLSYSVSAPVVQHQVVEQVIQPTPYNVTQNYFYGVGGSMVQEAMLTRAVSAAMAEHKFNLEVTGNLNAAVAGSYISPSGTTPLTFAPPSGILPTLPPATVPDPASTPPPSSPGEEAPVFTMQDSVVATSCLKCHTGKDPKGGFSMDVPLSPAQALQAVQRIATGEMPPSGPLPQDKARQAILELSQGQ